MERTKFGDDLLDRTLKIFRDTDVTRDSERTAAGGGNFCDDLVKFVFASTEDGDIGTSLGQKLGRWLRLCHFRLQ